jgi:hypothetical protein
VIIIKYLKAYLFTLIFIIIFLFILTLLYYYNLINPNIYKLFKLLIILISLFISNYNLGKKTTLNKYIFSLPIIVILFIYSIIINSFKLKVLIYYLIILLISITSNSLGKKKKKKN